VLTSTDIPPGGEGEIEVTFDSSHKIGQQKKAITVESNDPQNAKATLSVSAVVEVLLGFEQYVLDLGRIRKGQPAVLTTTVIVKDPSISNSVTLTSSNPLITAALVDDPAAGGSGAGKLTVEVTASPEMPAGKINATLTARAGDSKVPDATIQVQGNVIGNLEVQPDMVQFHVDTLKSDAKPSEQVVKVVSIVDDPKLRLLKVVDENQMLAIHVDTLLAGKQYAISMMPQPSVLKARQNVAGTVTVTTDDKYQPTMSVTYFVSFGR
jgi:hypothetical protein